MVYGKDLIYSTRTFSALFLIVNKLQMNGDKYLGELTVRQVLAIPAIIHAPKGNASIKLIATELGTSKQSAKQIVDALVKKEYLCIEPNFIDKRAVNIVITSRGLEIFKESQKRFDEYIADVFDALSSEELRTLYSITNKLNNYESELEVSEFNIDGINNIEELTSDNEKNILSHHESYVKRRKENERNKNE